MDHRYHWSECSGAWPRVTNPGRVLTEPARPGSRKAELAGEPIRSGPEDQAAVDVEHLRGDPARLVREQEQAGAHHVRRLTEPPQGGGLHQVAGHIADHG